MKHRLLFICFGNICRSSMAEFVCKHLVHERGLDDAFEIASAATSTVSVGQPIDSRAKEKLAEHGIPCKGHVARQMTQRDYQYYDMIIGMDFGNLKDLYRMTDKDPDNKISLLLDHAGRRGEEIPDPWYTHDFDATWDDIYAGCEGLLGEII